jgi:hypothetical protein
LLKIGLFRCVEEEHVPLHRIPFMLEAAASSNFFPVRIELVFERNTS